MEIEKKLEDALNAQIDQEARASWFYLSAGTWAGVNGFDGAARFFYSQSDEERGHMLKIIHYLDDAGIQAEIPSLRGMSVNFDDLESAIRESLELETRVKKSLNELLDIVQETKEYGIIKTVVNLIENQTKEINNYENILQKFEIYGSEGFGISKVDELLAAESED